MYYISQLTRDIKFKASCFVWRMAFSNTIINAINIQPKITSNIILVNFGLLRGDISFWVFRLRSELANIGQNDEQISGGEFTFHEEISSVGRVTVGVDLMFTSVINWRVIQYGGALLSFLGFVSILLRRSNLVNINPVIHAEIKLIVWFVDRIRHFIELAKNIEQN